jgi:hypothetical protein
VVRVVSAEHVALELEPRPPEREEVFELLALEVRVLGFVAKLRARAELQEVAPVGGREFEAVSGDEARAAVAFYRGLRFGVA